MNVQSRVKLKCTAVTLQVKLRECEEVLENDYFLAALKDEFVENARLFIFETYCRIHQCIDLRMLAGMLPLNLLVFSFACTVSGNSPTAFHVSSSCKCVS